MIEAAMPTANEARRVCMRVESAAKGASLQVALSNAASGLAAMDYGVILHLPLKYSGYQIGFSTEDSAGFRVLGTKARVDCHDRVRSSRYNGKI